METNFTIPSAKNLAREFAQRVLKDVGPENHLELKHRTEQIILRNSNVCASHDFCDANESMIEALAKFGIELDCESDEQAALINEAWTIAKRNLFWM